MILRLGTAEEIVALESLNTAMRPLVDVIRKRTTEDERKALARKPTFRPSVQENREFDAEVWSKLRAGLEGLVSLPRPADVVTIVKKNVMRTEHVSRNLLTAHTWLEEFINAWTV